MFGRLLRSRRRMARMDPHASRLRRPVISIGNVSMGGRGKTPLTALVARLLVEAGERPAILSRGYGRTVIDDGVTVVSDGRVAADGCVDPSHFAGLAQSGDEPLMLANAVPGAAVLVCEQRALAGALAETSLGCTVHILDDGFQHHQLRRDVDIVLVTAQDLVARAIPFGRLREPIDSLNDADAVIFDGDPVTLDGVIADRPEFVGALRRSLGTPSYALESGARVVAVAGIATPARFFASLAAAGWTLSETLPFRDHHAFSASDARRIGDAATRSGAAAILVTSKDVLKLAALGPWPVPLVEMPLDVNVDPADEFRTWLLASIA